MNTVDYGQLKILFLSGVPNDNRGNIVIDAKGKTNILISGSANLANFLADLPGVSYNFYLAGLGESQPYEIPFWPNVIVNQISDADSHEQSLIRSLNLIKTQACPVINHPESINNTRRELIYQNLNNVKGLVVPKTTRFYPAIPADVKTEIDEQSFTYPVIFRRAGDHGGISTSLINSEVDIEPTLYQYALDGSPFYLTQFIDYADADHKYRKVRLVVVDGKAYVRHAIISDSWLIHSSSRRFMQENDQFDKEEDAFLLGYEVDVWPKIAPTIEAITAILALDYYGIDCNIADDGTILAFEINANMNVLINHGEKPNRWQQPIETIRQAVINLIKSKAQFS
jgi:glutathione synthase/RimK-type ligase-like ATP-grasp enzyme